MMLSAIKENIADRLSQTGEALAIIKKRLESFVEENLAVRKECGKIRYHAIKHNSERYLGKGEEKTIRELELKHYYILLEKAASREVKTLEKCQNLLERIPDYDKVFYAIPEHKRHLIEPFSVAMNPKMPEKWRNMYITNKNIPVEANYKTEGGVRVRSKSELIIAERLERADIPYRYEYPVTVGNSLWFPDFLVLNRQTGKEYIWEHFGMTDDPAYCKSMLEKIEKYAENGMFAGQNLIATYESSKHSLSTAYVDLLIKRYLK